MEEMNRFGKYKMWGEITHFRYHTQYYYMGPLTCGRITCQPNHSSCHVAPPGRPRGLAWACHVYAPHPCHAGTRVALPHGLACHVTSTRVPRCATLARSSCADNTPFLPFLKGLKIKINSRKIHKNLRNSEIHIFKNITPFKLKFSPLAHKFISF